jgi:hypothetical protein
MLTTESVTYLALAIEVVAFIDASARPSTTLHENSSHGPERPSACRAAWQDEVSSVTCAQLPGVVPKPVVTVLPVGEVNAVRLRVDAPAAPLDELLEEPEEGDPEDEALELELEPQAPRARAASNERGTTAAWSVRMGSSKSQRVADRLFSARSVPHATKIVFAASPP